MATAVLIARTVPVIARSLVLGALVISLTVVAYAYPFARRYQADPSNPSLYLRNVAAGLLLVLAVVWGVAAALLLVRMVRERIRS